METETEERGKAPVINTDVTKSSSTSTIRWLKGMELF